VAKVGDVPILAHSADLTLNAFLARLSFYMLSHKACCWAADSPAAGLSSPGQSLSWSAPSSCSSG
jgi:hypothetical protein